MHVAVSANCNVMLDVQDLPQHCLLENRTEGLLISVGLSVMLLELSAMYCTLTCVLNLASKRLD